MERMEDETKQQISQLTTRLHDRSTENAALRLDTDRLKVCIALITVLLFYLSLWNNA